MSSKGLSILDSTKECKRGRGDGRRKSRKGSKKACGYKKPRGCKNKNCVDSGTSSSYAEPGQTRSDQSSKSGNRCNDSTDTSSLCGWNCGVKYGGFCGGNGCDKADGKGRWGPGVGDGRTAFKADGGACGKGGKCNTVCYKRCDSHPSCKLKSNVVTGAKYENPTPCRNVGIVPCSECGPCFMQIGGCEPAV